MNYNIDKKEGHAYLQLYCQLRTDIINGVFGYNSKLPSKRTLSENAGVSAVTVEHAYALLCDEGYVDARERSGYFVIFRTDDGFATPANTPGMPSAAFHPPLSQPDFPFPLLAKTMRRVLAVYKDSKAIHYFKSQD